MASWTGIDNVVHGENYSLHRNHTTTEKELNRSLRRGRSGRKLRKLLLALTGSAVGQSKALTEYRVKHETTQFGLGGKRTIEAVNLVTGNTTSADLAHIDEVLAEDSQPDTYPPDKSGVPAGGRTNQI